MAAAVVKLVVAVKLMDLVVKLPDLVVEPGLHLVQKIPGELKPQTSPGRIPELIHSCADRCLPRAQDLVWRRWIGAEPAPAILSGACPRPTGGMRKAAEMGLWRLILPLLLVQSEEDQLREAHNTDEALNLPVKHRFLHQFFRISIVSTIKHMINHRFNPGCKLA
jgi:hypothetical protein